MAQAVLRNNREHDIALSYLSPQTQEVATVVVPGAKASPLDANTMIPGETLVDEPSIKAAIKKYPVIKSYFDNGWLRWAASLSVEAEPQA